MKDPQEPKVNWKADSDVITGYTTAPFEIAELEGMLDKDPNNEMLLDIAAFKYYTSGALEQALSTYERLVRINYEKAVYHFYLANTFYKLRFPLKAFAEWKAAWELDPRGQLRHRWHRRADDQSALRGRRLRQYRSRLHGAEQPAVGRRRREWDGR